MKKTNVVIGEVYLAKVSGTRVKVRIVSESPYGGWNAVNLTTKREVRIKTAARLNYAYLPKEQSAMSRVSELAQAARKVHREEAVMEGPLATEEIQ